ncbi:superoxide dismutase [Muricomes intestini]|jgi:Fe-Mn family superoxide dismutase|uniref:Superoxide dismutase n=1 Tax=Muricomes intestini TaxID=1796634 RepID=A0A4R3K3R6_9FIRM|nr:superoxide dismutase [Muricomes intestini]TCS77305.1 Fe-Mn family superoxide dismutase [Muricomes intestini]HAX53409.1 superoxide dismutase [Lachnospiraceae bacterium]HCR83597.1 superoxide dismutase [Lachnospiraceae bacterium]
MYTQYKLPYSYDALEPHIDALTMETHYSKHHAAYTKNLNDAVEKAGINKGIEALLSSLDSISDEALRKTIRNNGGGYYNHNLYFSTIGTNGGGEPAGAFGKLLANEFGGFSSFQDKLSALAIGQFGSGWAWLSADRDGKLKLSSSPNQDNPLMEGTGFVPILGIDVWEHAYYLKYKNVRADYVKAFYNVIDWKAVADNYERVKGGK